MTESENRRKSPDRRQKKIKDFPNNQRQDIRRKDDKDDIKFYYYVLLLLTVIIFAFGISAYIY